MSDIKPKLMLRPGLNLSDKSPSPSTKLMLNHGKPNFTINRSKSRVDSQTPQTPEANQVILKSTTLNGFVKPSTLKLNGENEVNKVVLRRTVQVNSKPVEDDEPEFMKAQRRIAERLAKESNLDFENRKSGYFTHVMMSPTSPRTLELPVIESTKIQQATVLQVPDVAEVVAEPAPPVEQKPVVEEKTIVENGKTEVAEEQKPVVEEKTIVENGKTEVEESTQNGHDEVKCNGNAEVEKEDTEVVQAAKALVEEVVQSVPEDIQIQNGESQPQENGHDTIPTTTSQADVNFEPTTVTSFAKDLSNEPNNYPDTVMVTKEVESTAKDSAFIEEMSKLKFDITEENLEVTPTLKADTPVA